MSVGAIVAIVVASVIIVTSVFIIDMVHKFQEKDLQPPNVEKIEVDKKENSTREIVKEKTQTQQVSQKEQIKEQNQIEK